MKHYDLETIDSSKIGVFIVDLILKYRQLAWDQQNCVEYFPVQPMQQGLRTQDLLKKERSHKTHQSLHKLKIVTLIEIKTKQLINVGWKLVEFLYGVFKWKYGESMILIRIRYILSDSKDFPTTGKRAKNQAVAPLSFSPPPIATTLAKFFIDQTSLLISPWPTSASRIVVVNPLAKISSLKFSRARSQSFHVGISQNSNLSATTTVLHRPPWQICSIIKCNQNRLVPEMEKRLK